MPLYPGRPAGSINPPPKIPRSQGSPRFFVYRLKTTINILQNQKEINDFPIPARTILSRYYSPVFHSLRAEPGKIHHPHANRQRPTNPSEILRQTKLHKTVDFPSATGYTVIEPLARRALRSEYNAHVCLASASDGALNA